MPLNPIISCGGRIFDNVHFPAYIKKDYHSIEHSQPFNSVEQNKPSIITKLNPAVPRYYLFGLAGLLWTIAGGLLCTRAIIWLDTYSLSVELALALTSAGLAIAGYFLLFVNVVQKNLNRIDSLPNRACVFGFTAWTGYLMIACMMTIGITLRSTSLPRYFLAVPYAAMGTILLIGSARFFRRFMVSFAHRKD